MLHFNGLYKILSQQSKVSGIRLGIIYKPYRVVILDVFGRYIADVLRNTEGYNRSLIQGNIITCKMHLLQTYFRVYQGS